MERSAPDTSPAAQPQGVAVADAGIGVIVFRRVRATYGAPGPSRARAVGSASGCSAGGSVPLLGHGPNRGRRYLVFEVWVGAGAGAQVRVGIGTGTVVEVWVGRGTCTAVQVRVGRGTGAVGEVGW